MGENIILEIKNFCVGYSERGRYEEIAHNLNFSLKENKILGLIGASGSGKTITSLAMLKLLPWGTNWEIKGEVLYKEQGNFVDLLKLNERSLQLIRGKEIAMIFQEPASSLNPVLKVGVQVGEVLRAKGFSRQEVYQRIVYLFKEVDLAEELIERFPHQLSGGQIQRVMIALALAQNPKILIADEPTTALDTITQQHFLEFLKRIKEKFKLSVLFISHNLKLIKSFADEIAVMKDGRLISYDTTESVFKFDNHPYTRELIEKGLFFTNYNCEQLKSKEQEQENRQAVLEINDLSVDIIGKSRWFGRNIAKILNKINIKVFEGEVVGVIGVSGAGKTTLARAILKLIDLSSGNVTVLGQDLNKLSSKELRRFRSNFQIVFQSPLASLNPLMRVGEAIAEVLLAHKKCIKRDVRGIVEELLKEVGLPSTYYDRYPRHLSTGQRQRVVLARALCLKPKLLICDEPFASLDNKVKMEIFQLLLKLREKMKLTILLISHDLEVIKAMCERVIVLENGEVVDEGYTSVILESSNAGVDRSLMGPPLKF